MIPYIFRVIGLVPLLDWAPRLHMSCGLAVLTELEGVVREATDANVFGRFGPFQGPLLLRERQLGSQA